LQSIDTLKEQTVDPGAIAMEQPCRKECGVRVIGGKEEYARIVARLGRVTLPALEPAWYRAVLRHIRLALATP